MKLAAAVLTSAVVGCSGAGHSDALSVRTALESFSPEELPPPPPDVTNRFADDTAAAALGQKFFFDPRFSGPLLVEDQNGSSAALGAVGETGKVACASCHNPEHAFLDHRSPRGQVSLGAGWTRRRAPSLLDVGQAQLLMWDGRRDAAYNQVFAPIESPVELNSSRLFVAQQIARLYADEYETVFGKLPALAAFAELSATEAGCSEAPADEAAEKAGCPKPFDSAVTSVVVNFGKAVSAYLRQLSCGQSRFDAFMHGEDDALSAEELHGAELFAGKGQCSLCHSGPFFTDQKFHNIGLPPATVALFLSVGEDPGARPAFEALRDDPLNTRAEFSDGYDGRIDFLDAAVLSPAYDGAFRTPGLRCVNERPSLMHTGQIRSLEDAVAFLSKGGGPKDFVGTKDVEAVNLSDEEQADIVAFLRALAGPGPEASLQEAPELPADP